MRPTTISSTPVMRAALRWTAGIAVVLAVVGALVGYLVAGTSGLWSALTGIVLAIVFLALTGLSVLVANRWYGGPLYVPIFFGIVLGAWVLKFIAFIAVLLLVRDQPWVDPVVFFLSLVAGVLVSLAVDVIVMVRMRLPYVGEVDLPDADESGEARSAD
ncbi:hypothetical protein GCM10022200_12090 [Microbacterium awajiense]|uniref:ATP synthase protein I n=1 Tax=Microbacterium awajiense TaxID=415214 RepID=A0ABP7AFN5_9MICO